MEKEDDIPVELDVIIENYFKAYLEKDNSIIYLRVIAISEYFNKKADKNKQFSDFNFYLNKLINNQEFIAAFTFYQKIEKYIYDKINEIEHNLRLKTNDIQLSNLLYFNPEQLVLYLLYSSVSEIFQLKSPINKFPLNFSYIIRKVSNQPTIYFLYDVTEQVEYCEYTGRIMPVNNKKYRGVYDYHLPIYKLFEKYTNYSLCLTNNRDEINNNPYIYIHTIDHIYDFFEEYCSNFHKTIPANIFQDINRGKAIYIFNSAQEGLSISNFYYKIQQVIRDNFNKKYLDNVFFFSGNYYEAKSVKKYNQGNLIPSVSILPIIKNFIYSNIHRQQLNSYPFRYFEECIAMQYNRHYKPYHYNIKLKHLQENNFKTFLCFNGHKKIFRYAFCFLLWKHNLLEVGSVSLRKIDNLNECSDQHQKKIISKILLSDKVDFNNFKKQLPLIADKQNIHLNYWYQVSLDLVNNTFLWIITETTFGGQFYNFSFSFLTEKTYKPIALFMPFIMVGDRHSLKILKEEGYQTFSKWWSEEYDNIYDKVKRMQAVINILRYINSKSKVELIKIYEEMKPVLEHNFNNLMHRNAGGAIMLKIGEQYKAL